MDKTTILESLNRLGDLLTENNKKYTLTCAGGIVFLLYFSSRDTTADIDCLFPEPWNGKGFFKKLVHQVGEEYHLPKKWMNDGVTFFGLETTTDIVLFQHPNLTLVSAKFEELLAHKIRALRDKRDENDIMVLFAHIDELDKEKLWDMVVKYDPKMPTLKDGEMRKRYDFLYRKYQNKNRH